MLREHPLAAPRRFAVSVRRDLADPEKKLWLVQTVHAISASEMGEMTQHAIQGLYGEFMRMKAERVLKSRGIDPKAVVGA